MIGRTLSHFKITAKLGEGGMGEVYSAEDTKLGRDVAIKVLPEAFTEDPERFARFEREAHVLASLNHPNIAAIYDLAEDQGTHFLVLELAEGEDLAARLSRGPVPVEEALPLALQIAEGMEAAHGKGIVHRDLKPANVMVGPDGKVKVLDFGLAKAWEAEPGESGNLSMLPTLTAQMTQAGVILGTASYMSPEQARGKPVDHRTDIWAFGCCLYEALTGRRAFDGNDASMIQASILTSAPDWSVLPAGTPPALCRLLRRCLEKDPNRRLQHVGDIRLEIQELLEAPRGDEVDVGTVSPAQARGRWASFAAVFTLVVAAAGAGWTVARLARPDPPPTPSPRRFSIDLPSPMIATRSFPELSSDGEILVFRGVHEGTDQLFVRHLDELEARPIPGTEGATSLFLSPDGRQIGFASRRELKKTHIAGGAPETICQLRGPWPSGTSWGTDDTIVYGTFGGSLYQVSAAGGEPQPLTTLDEQRGDRFHSDPEVLPGGRAVLFTLGLPDVRRLAVASLESGEVEVLGDGSSGRYVPTGHVVFVRGSSLWAMPFDLDRLEATGPAVLVLEDAVAGRNFTVSADGSLVYVPIGAVPESSLVWVDRDGNATPATKDRQHYLHPRVSPDGRRIAVTIRSRGQGSEDVWVLDVERGVPLRLTVEGSVNRWPVWTSDGDRIVFSSIRGGEYFDLYWRTANGEGQARPLLARENFLLPMSWSERHSTLAFYEVHPDTYRDIWILPADGDPEPFVTTPFNDRSPVFSPDGRWLAYVSDESGRDEVYVREYPRAERRWPISNGGGKEPLWSRDGRELYFRRGHEMMVLAVKTEPTFEPAPARVLFEAAYELDRIGGNPNYDVAPDGRFLMVRHDEASRQASLVVVIDWFEELQRLMSTGR